MGCVTGNRPGPGENEPSNNPDERNEPFVFPVGRVEKNGRKSQADGQSLGKTRRQSEKTEGFEGRLSQTPITILGDLRADGYTRKSNLFCKF